jgi:hypothetical protein
MTYAIRFEQANLRTIFSLTADRYVGECVEKAKEAISGVAPNDHLFRISHRPEAFSITGKLTPELKTVLLRLPFVSAVENEDEMRQSIAASETFIGRIKGWAQDRIYLM